MIHHCSAAAQARIEQIDAEVRPGGLRDAILYSVGANAAHGLRRSNADKRRAVMRLLEDAEWSAWANTKIARQCGVDEKTVRSLRDQLTPSSEVPKIDRPRLVERGGRTYEQNTARMDTARPHNPACATS